MILVVNLCSSELSYDEFVQPIVNLVGKCDVKNFKDVKSPNRYDTIILSGVPMKDDGYLQGEFFGWLREFKGKLLGICAGMQVLGLEFGCSLIDSKEIGMKKIEVVNGMLGNLDFEAYSLHNHALEISESFDVMYKSKNCVQGIKLRNREFYGVLFHPEVRTKDIIKNFLKI